MKNISEPLQLKLQQLYYNGIPKHNYWRVARLYDLSTGILTLARAENRETYLRRKYSYTLLRRNTDILGIDLLPI